MYFWGSSWHTGAPECWFPFPRLLLAHLKSQVQLIFHYFFHAPTEFHLRRLWPIPLRVPAICPYVWCGAVWEQAPPNREGESSMFGTLAPPHLSRCLQHHQRVLRSRASELDFQCKFQWQNNLYVSMGRKSGIHFIVISKKDIKKGICVEELWILSK